MPDQTKTGQWYGEYGTRQASLSSYQELVARGKAGLQAMLLLGCLCLLYGPVLVGLGHMWWEHDRLDGFLIPLISLYMIWQKRDELRNVQVKPATSWGLSLATLAGFLLVVGHLGGIAILQEISLITMIVGLVLLLLGKAFLKTFSLPIAYLCFAFSIIGELFGPLHRPFQLLTAKMAVTFLQMLGFAALAEQHYIVLPGMTLEVVKGCSGVTYLVSIIAIGLPLAYLTLGTWWSRVTLILSAVVIGIIANWARVVLIAIWAYLGGDNLHGPFHIFQGMFVAWAGYVMLFAGAWGLSKIDRPIPRSEVTSDARVASVNSGLLRYGGWNRAYWMALVILIVFIVYLMGYERGSVELQADLATFPIRIGDWTGEATGVHTAIFRIQGADVEMARTYRNPEGHQIHLYVAYLKSQRQGKEIVDYLEAGLHQDARALDIQIIPGRSISVNEGHYARYSDKYQILFWFNVNGRTIANRYQAKVATVLQAMILGRTNGSLVLIAAEDHGDERPAQVVIEDFAREILPLLRSYLLPR